jgi:hypothetical protein
MALSTDPLNVQCASPNRPGFWPQLWEVSSPLRWADIFVFALILGFGAFQFFYADLASNFLGDDVFNADAGRSLVQHGFYGINGYIETNVPPALPWLLGLVSIVGGFSHLVFLRTMAVFGTLAFLASYELLRRQAPRLVAAGICLLLMSSATHFEMATQWISNCYPCLFTAMCALLAARKLEKASLLASRIGWGALLAALIAASIMLASAGIAFMGAIVASICAAFFFDRRLAFARLKVYLPVFLFGIAVQGLWMHQQSVSVEASDGIGAQEWPVLGFPHSYVAQLKVKNGNYPELGLATPRDIAVRVLDNAYHYSYLLSKMLLRGSAYITFISILILGPLLLIALGWCYSVWPKGGGLQDWYFAAYGFIYLLWPWTPEPRFFLPVAPLACFYIWRGANALLFLAKIKPRLLGFVCFPPTVLLTVATWLWMNGYLKAGKLPHAGLQDETSFLAWLSSAILAGWLICAGTDWLTQAQRLVRWPTSALKISPVRVLQVSGIVVAAGLIVSGLSMQLKMGRSNLDLNSPGNRLPPDAEAAAWVNSHTDTKAVIMARQVPIAYHYSQRKVVWFPPSSNPQLLIEGILKYKVDFVIVVRREDPYFLPSEDDCFAPLLTVFPETFRLAYQAPKFRIFHVTQDVSPAFQATGNLVH